MRSISDAIATFHIKEALLAFISPYLPQLPDPEQIVNNVLHSLWIYVGYPFIKLCVIVNVLSLIAGSSAYIIRQMILPRAVMNEIVYFDFSAQPTPYASLNVLKLEKQWEYVSTDGSPDGGANNGRTSGAGYSELKLDHYFTPGALYNVDMKLIVPLSSRNRDLGKFMVHMVAFDSAGDAIARSSRPVILPTQHDWAHLMTSILTYPYRLIGLMPHSNVIEVTLPFMSRYREPHQYGRKGGGGIAGQQPPTESFDMVSE